MKQLAWILALGTAVACTLSNAPGDPIPAEVAALERDGETNSPIVVLRESAGTREISIWIGEAEARSIAHAIHGIPSERPNTHDLATALVSAAGADVDHVVVTALRNDVFLAEVVLSTDGGTRRIDSRASDAIALALRSGVPIRVHASVWAEAGERSVFEVAPDDRQVPARSL
jgi:hypothetical protein